MILLLALSVTAEAGSGPGEVLRPARTPVAPVLDGVLDDEVWSKALSVTGFRTFIPDFGKVIPESTIAYAAYDDENLYFAFRCFDPSPGSIKATIAQRDNIRNDDWICLNIDTFNDHQALFAFYVNPLGIQMDSRCTNTSEDVSVDLVWQSAGRLTGDGYVVEVSIPLKSIRYDSGDPTRMAVFFERQVGRRLEHVSYPALDPKQGYQFLSQMTPMEYDGLRHYAFWELNPSLTYNQRFRASNGSFTKFIDKGEAGLTAKYGITPQLILDGTYNPDYSQVEADAGQVDINLRSSLFFAEKRLFFLEGTDLFSLAGVDQSRQQGILYGLYTRRMVHPLAGLKLTGKVSENGSLGSILVSDDLTDGRSTVYGTRAVFPILRYKYALDGDSYVGGLYSGREWGPTYNRVAGVDGIQRLTDATALEYHALGSSTRTSSGVAADGGQAVSVILRSNTRDLDWGVQANSVSTRFALDAGYLTRTGLQGFDAYYIPKWYPASSIVDRVQLALYGSALRDAPSGLWETNDRITWSFTILGSLYANLRGTYATEVFAGRRFSTSGGTITAGGQAHRTVNVSLNATFGNAVIYSAAPEQGRSIVLSSTVVLQPVEHVDLSLSAINARMRRESDRSLYYDYSIGRAKLTYQVNHYWFVRAIVEYNGYRKTLTDDFLASFTYIPGTVVHLGYGALFQRTAWDQTAYIPSTSYTEMYRGIFFKMSYLWRS